MAKKEREFKGGDKLKGIYKDYHTIMMQNELADGRGAYELSWAGTDKSGPSFGGNQMDLAYNAHGRKVLLNIVNKAVDANGQPFLNQQEVAEIQKIFAKPKKMIDKKVESVFKETKKIQLALQSPYGKKMIDQAHVNEVLWRAYKVEKFIESLDEGPGKNFAKTHIGKLCIFDFDNQYEMEKTGALYHFLNGRTYTFKSGKVVGPITKSNFNTEDLLKEFLSHLKYYEKHSKDVERRLKNIEQFVNTKRADEGEASMCACVEFFKLSKQCIIYPTSAMWYGEKASNIRSKIEAQYAQHPGQSVYEICKELHGMDFESYMQH